MFIKSFDQVVNTLKKGGFIEIAKQKRPFLFFLYDNKGEYLGEIYNNLYNVVDDYFITNKIKTGYKLGDFGFNSYYWLGNDDDFNKIEVLIYKGF